MSDTMRTNDTLPACRKPSEMVPFDGKRPPLSEAISDLTCRNLIQAAIEAMNFAYTPYSNFKVGAALMAANTKVYTGCNIENAAYGPTNCAERTAFFKAIYEGERDFDRIAIVGGSKGTTADDTCAPCGICRQVMMEFCNPETFKIILANGKEKPLELSFKELFPYGFGPDNLEK